MRLAVALGCLILAGCGGPGETPEAARGDQLDADLAADPQLGPAYTASFNSGVSLPAVFRGKWSSDPATCNTEGDDLDTHLIVEAATVSFYDETHVVTAVASLAPRSVRLSYSPPIEGYHYMVAPPILSVSEDGKSLRALDEGGKQHGRWGKCAEVSG